MKQFLFVVAVWMWMGVAPAIAKENTIGVYVATLQSVGFSPTQHVKVKTSRTSDEIWVNNSCGRFMAQYAVRNTIFGSRVRDLIVHDDIGEWCVPRLDVIYEPVFIIVENTKQGRVLRDTERIHLIDNDDEVILPIQVSTIATVDLTAFWKLLKEPICVGGVSSPTDKDTVRLLSEGAISLADEQVCFLKGIYLKDLMVSLRRRN